MIITGLSYFLIGLGIFFLSLGVYGIFRYKDFYTRILVASKVDTVGFLLIIIGLMFRQGFSFFTGKLLLVGILMVILNPFVAAIVVRSAFSDAAMAHPEGAEAEDQPLSEKEKCENSIDGNWI